jgi:hypothetical protein
LQAAEPIIFWACPRSKALRAKDSIGIALSRLDILLPHFYEFTLILTKARLFRSPEFVPPNSAAPFHRHFSESQAGAHLKVPLGACAKRTLRMVKEHD